MFIIGHTPVEYRNTLNKDNSMLHLAKLLSICFLITSVIIIPVGTADAQAPSASAQVADISHAFVRIIEITNPATRLDSEGFLKGKPSTEQLKEYLTGIEGITEECTGLYNSALSNMKPITVPRLRGTVNAGVQLPLKARTKILRLYHRTESDLNSMKKVQDSARSIDPDAGDAATRIMKLSSDIRTLALHAEEALQEIKTCPLYSQ